jgi:transposase
VLNRLRFIVRLLVRGTDVLHNAEVSGGHVDFNLERHVPGDHLLQAIDRFVDLSDIRRHLAPYYSQIGRPSIDPELLIRMQIVGYCFGIRSERRLCEEVHLNLVYRWFCRHGPEGDVPDHSTFSKTCNGRFRESDLLRELFETVLRRCMAEGLVGGEGFAVDASLIVADAHRQCGVTRAEDLPPAGRAVEEYLAVLDDAAFGGATPVQPKHLSPADPARPGPRPGARARDRTAYPGLRQVQAHGPHLLTRGLQLRS